jgi:radical S-adenosyl methionine domain-containing protein 2
MELVFNLHITERCNFHCEFCFGKWNISAQEEIFGDLKIAEKCIDEIIKAGLSIPHVNFTGIRLNFVGGEPGLMRNLQDIVAYCRSKRVRLSFVTNGLMFERYSIEWLADNFDVIGISLDSIDPEKCIKIGRASNQGKTLNFNELCSKVNTLRVLHSEVKVKVNTVVSLVNHLDYLGEIIERLSPEKWKVFRVLPVHGTINAISAPEFSNFLIRHEQFKHIMVSEDNNEMSRSYIMLDPLGRFFWPKLPWGSGYEYSQSILNVGGVVAFNEISIDWQYYIARYE